MPKKRGRGTADRILDIAERLVQVQGYNAFSYADVSKAVGIQKASLHHHFATKAALGQALVSRYRHRFMESLTTIETETADGAERVERYVGLYASVLRRNRMCMCGMLATDVATLPRPMRADVTKFFAENEAWLARVLDDGRRVGRLQFVGRADSMAALIVSTLEGAMLVSRGSDRLAYFDEVARRLLSNLVGRAKRRSPKRSSSAATPRAPRSASAR
jgi:TetR/AcrR family transcriptional repressor of nem operon